MVVTQVLGSRHHNNNYNRNVSGIYYIAFYSIIESVDSISRDGPDTPIYIIHYKK